MGFMSGEGANAFAKNFLSTYTTMEEENRKQQELEIAKQRQAQAQQMQAMQMQMYQQQLANQQTEQTRKANFQNAIQGLMAPQPGMDEGMVAEQLGQSAGMWGAPDINGVQNITDQGQMVFDQLTGPQQKQFTPEEYMQAVMPYMNESDQVELMKEKFRPAKPETMNEWTMLAAAARGDQTAIEALRLKRDVDQGQKKAPTGYRYTEDGGMEPVPGGPADSIRLQKQAQAFSKTAEISQGLDMISQTANELKQHKGLNGITGVRGKIPNIPGTDAANAAALLDSLKAQTGLTVLANLKAATGAGLGQVTEAEHKLLQNYLTQLNTAQDAQSFQKALDKIITYSEGAKGRLKDAFEKTYVSPSGKVTTPVESKYSGKVQAYASEVGVDPNLVMSMMKAESNFNPQAVSTKGAQGLMQLMPGTAKMMGVKDPYDADQNIKGGAKYVAYLQNLMGTKDPEVIVAAYNAGPKTINDLKSKYGADWRMRLPAETKMYLKKVLGGLQEEDQGDGWQMSKSGIKYKVRG